MRNEDKRTRTLLEYDQLHSMKGSNNSISLTSNHENLIYNQHYVQCNALATETLIQSDDISVLTQIRALLFRGKINIAHQLLEENKSKFKNQPLTFIELLQEEARLAFLNGEYRYGLELSEQALLLKPEHISRLALLQMKALALFELGEFNYSNRIIEESITLTQLFTHSASVHYLKAIESKIIARHQGPKQARDYFTKYIENIVRDQTINLEILSVFARVQIDLCCLEMSSFESWALASYWIEKIMGEELYVGHALIYIYLLNRDQKHWLYTKVLPDYLERFPRLQKLLYFLEHDSADHESTSAATLKNYINFYNTDDLNSAKDRKIITQNTKLDNFLTQPKSIFISSLNLFISLNTQTKEIKTFDIQDKVPSAMTSLYGRSLTKEEFFQANWGTQKYVPHLHDGLIRNLIFRIRKKTNLQIDIKDGLISISDLLVV